MSKCSISLYLKYFKLRCRTTLAPFLLSVSSLFSLCPSSASATGTSTLSVAITTSTLSLSSPGPSPDSSYSLGSYPRSRRCIANGTWQITSPTSSCPIAPSYSPSKPSTSSNQLCRAQQVSQILLHVSMLCSLMPVFNILHLPFKIPKVHSTSLQSDSHQ